MTTPANRLQHETSPYLRQHAHQPVDWYPWGAEALNKARQEDKPIFLSIGYSTCHWCHVMAHECFENPEIAAFMNEHFVNIKVDREERPDLDETYMNAVHLLAGRGGWPMSVFLTPDLKPFYAGTYFPPQDRAGLPGFQRLLVALSQAYREKRDFLTGFTQQIVDRLHLLAQLPTSPQEFTWEDLDLAAAHLLKDFDNLHGGLGGAPKFPRALELSFLLHYAHSQKDLPAWRAVAQSLAAMAQGGIYDQVGGGFHRYTVDAAWVVPHFEKMLYDNALLVPLYLALYQLTGSPLGKRLAQETLNFVLRELTAPQGGFFAAWDADSEGQEGKFYLWHLSEVEAALDPDDLPLALTALGVTATGNFEGQNILTRRLTDAELAARFSLTETAVQQKLARILARLYQVREARVRPHRDEKIITSWNALMISALALGAQVLGNKDYHQAALRAAAFILSTLRQNDRLYRLWAAGQVSVPGFLEDYAFFANACLDLYETDFDPQWLAEARRLTEMMDAYFLDLNDGVYFFVAHDQETPLVRSKNFYDQAIPSGNSMAARLLWRLFRFTGEERFFARAQVILRRFHSQSKDNPFGFGHLLTVATLSLTPPLDLTLVGDPADPHLLAMITACWQHFLPTRRLMVKNPTDCHNLEKMAPPLKDYAPQEKAAAYICQNFTCWPPITDPAALRAKLLELAGPSPSSWPSGPLHSQAHPSHRAT